MPFRTNINTKITVDGKPYTVLFIDNPTVEDVLVVEMKVWARNLQNNTPKPTRRVPPSIRDVLIRLGIPR